MSAEILDAVLARSTGKGSPIHGERHWAAVAAAGLPLADATHGADPYSVLLFAIFHDSMHLSDGPDPEHGARAAGLLGRLRRDGVVDLDGSRAETLARALERHDKGETSGDPTVGVCWDADRLDLRRVGIRPDPDLMSTGAGRRAAVRGPASLLSGAARGWGPLFADYEARTAGGFPYPYGHASAGVERWMLGTRGRPW